ncbi:MAG: tetratricopeptide repeat protein [Caldimicrobium sp.]
MKKIVLCLLFYFLIFASSSFGQDAINECFTFYKAGDYERAIQAGQRAVKLYPRNADAYHCLGASYLFVGELKLAVEYLKKAESLASDKIELAAVYNRLGQALNLIGDLDSALHYYFKVLAIARELGDKGGEAVALNNIAGIYQDKRDYEKALAYYQQSLNLEKDDKGKATTYNNIAVVYSAKGDHKKR